MFIYHMTVKLLSEITCHKNHITTSVIHLQGFPLVSLITLINIPITPLIDATRWCPGLPIQLSLLKQILPSILK